MQPATITPTAIASPDEPRPELPEKLYQIPHGVLSALLAERPPVLGDVSHIFASGVAARLLRLPAGTLATARRHKRDHICILLEGEMTVWADGIEARVLTAPEIFVTEEGIAWSGYVHAEALWVAIFPNPKEERDEDALLEANEERAPLAVPGAEHRALLAEVLS